MRITLKQIRKATFLLALLLLAGGVGYWFGQSRQIFQNGDTKIQIIRQTPVDKPTVKFDLFWNVWDQLGASFIDKEKVNPVEMVYGAIRGMVASLGDPYTVFLTPEENLRTQEDLAGSFGGVGIQLGYIDDSLAVIAPLKDSPAEQSGVRAGDLILEIDGKGTGEMTLPQAVDLIRGPKGSKVVLKLFRSETSLEVEIVRDTITVKSVEVEFLDNWCGKADSCPLVADLQLTRFGDLTNAEWVEAVREIENNCLLQQKSCLGVVFDLRNNPGGYLTSSVFIASEFISSGTVVQQETADGKRQSYSVDRPGKLLEIPLVVLVNKGSASASEIVAGCLKEYQRAKIIGETTFGKGTIQEAQDFSGGAGLHITTARWLLPNGQSIDGKGLVPDVEIAYEPESEDDLQLKKAIEVLSAL
ncbi:MAG TPA: S41 family peptidase [Candidatus Bathyarchaeia archaeon]|nr:S41 family peptidase [Candidatus Bathyarchaeia archaeon]